MIESLYDKDERVAYKNLQQLEKISENSDTIYKYMDRLIKMLDNEKSYIRVRGFRLICKNAKWDMENKINQHIDQILQELEDERPTAVRQCLAVIKEIIKYKKELDEIKEKLNHLKPLIEDIGITYKIVKREETNCKWNGEYCLLVYSKEKENYLLNVGYMIEQLDLYMASLNIGVLVRLGKNR